MSVPRKLFTAALSGCIAAAGPAFGEEEAPAPGGPRSGAIEEIVVTAQKRAENLQEVPISISALTQAAIEERQVTGLADVAAQTPGFEFANVIGAGQAAIRGVGFALVSGAGENSVALHSDGVFLPRPGASTMLQEDLGAVEVLRGPQGTLYGRNATGGVINLVSVPPPESLDFGGGILIGNLERAKAKLYLGSGFFKGTLRLRVSGVHDDTNEDIFENVAFDGLDQGASKSQAVRFDADWLPTESVRFQLRAFRGVEDFNGPLYEAYKAPTDSTLAPPGSYAPKPYEIAINDKGVTEQSLAVASLKATLDLFESWTLTSLTGFSETRFRTRGYDGDGTRNDVFTVYRLNLDDAFTEELLLTYSTPAIDWVVGGFYLNEGADNDSDVIADVRGVTDAVRDALLGSEVSSQLPPFGGIGGPVEAFIETFNIEQTDSIAGFTDVTWSALESLRVFSGVRYTHEEKLQILTSRTTSANSASGPVNAVNCDRLRVPLDYDAVTGRGGLQIDLLDDLMAYGQFARGFKAGGFAVALCDDTFEPEKLDSIELGFKSTWLDDRLRVNGAGFLYDYDNLQVEEVNLPNLSVNNAQAKVDGAEIEMLMVPMEGLELAASFAYLNARYTEFVNDDNTSSEAEALAGGPPQDLAGNVLNRAPRFAGGMALDYALDLGAFGRVAVRGEATGKSKIWLREFNNATDFQNAHAIVNAYLNYLSPGGSIAVRGFMKNATNEAVLAGFVGIAGYKNASYNPPRLVGLSMDYRFGGS